MHITASVFINDDEGGLHRDYARWLEELAPPRAGLPLSAQPHGGGQRGRAPQAPGDGPRGGGRRDEREVRLRPLGADLLRRVRRPQEEAGPRENHRGVASPLTKAPP